MEGGRLLGRAAAIEQLTDVLDAAEAGRSGIVLVSGEAGIGKTRLITEACELARSQGFLVLAGRCVDIVGPAIPYLPIADLLSALPDGPARVPGGDAHLSFFTGVRSALERLAQADPLLVVL
jgi:predicted ATPase